MAARQAYEPEFEKLASPASNSPLSPPDTRGGTPVSFKPNVNRAKTKRWVEAKQYSYDGDDWGDDDYDEYDGPNDEPAPQSTVLNQRAADASKIPPRGSSNPSLGVMDRSRSMDQVQTIGGGRPTGSRTLSADEQASQSPGVEPGGSRRPPIIRPAEIYQRMREEKAAKRQSLAQNPGPEETPNVGQSVADPVSQNIPSTTGHETSAGYNEHGPHPPLQSVTDSKANKEESQSPKNTSSNEVPSIKLPEVKRISSFGADLLGGSLPSEQNKQSTEPESQLQHNPSIGLRSAVHQAFDVPETPSSAVERSNSDSTSGVSPLIASRGFSEDRTPTIAEEPAEYTPRGDSSERNSIIFKPGHRRDLSLPSPGNSPSRKPIVTDNDQIPASSLAEVSSVAPDSPEKQDPSPSNMPPKDIPLPLRVSSPTGYKPSPSSEVLPVIMREDNSPQDADHDRLRNEIMQSLSRENTPSEDPESRNASRPQTRREDSLVPSEYERYWNDEASLSPHDQRRPSAPEYDSPPASRNLHSSDSPSVSVTAPNDTPKLKRRFSWESASSEELAPAVGLTSQALQSATSFEAPAYNAATGSNAEPALRSSPQASSLEESGRPEKPKLTIIPPSTVDGNSISERHITEVYNPAAAAASTAYSPAQASSPARALPLSTDASTLLGFRDILGIQSSAERVKAFNRTRDQFGKIDTGLNQWIQVTVHAHPEHTDVIEQSQKLSAGGLKVAPKSKFPKLPSIGNFGAHTERAPPGHGHVRRSSAPLGSVTHKQQVEQRGKDFLHTAGALGGRAGEAAKGFFARGRSKFKAGNEKDFLLTRGRRRSLPLQKLPSIFTIEEESCDKPQSGNGSLSATRPKGYRSSLDSSRKQVHMSKGRDDLSRSEDVRAKSAGDVTSLGFNNKGKFVEDVNEMDGHRLSLSTDAIQFLERTGQEKPVSAIYLESAIAYELRLGNDQHESSSESNGLDKGKSSGVSPPDSSEVADIREPDASDLRDHARPDAGSSGLDENREISTDKEKGHGKETTQALSADAVESSANDSTKIDRATQTSVSGIHEFIQGFLSGADQAGATAIVPKSDATMYKPPAALDGRGHLESIYDTKPDSTRNGDRDRSFKRKPLHDVTHDATISNKSSHSAMRSLESTLSIDNLPKARDIQPKGLSSNTLIEQHGPSTASRLHQIPSISSLGAQDTSIGTIGQFQNPSLGLAQGNHSISMISLPSEFTGGQLRRTLSTRSMDSAWPSERSRSAPGRGSTRHNSIRRRRNSFDDILSQSAADSTRANAPNSEYDLTDEAVWGRPLEAQRGESAFRMLRRVGKLPHIGRYAPHKKAFCRLSELFNRSSIQPGAQPRDSNSNQHQNQQHQQSVPTQTHFEYFKRPISPSTNQVHQSLRGQPPPLQGYYAPSIQTTLINRMFPTSAYNYTYQQPYYYYQPTPTPTPQTTSPYYQPPQSDRPSTPRGRSTDRSYVQDLHLRSRSPKSFPPSPEERTIPSSDITDPAYTLGTFRSSNPRLSRHGDQELPWKLTIPEPADGPGSAAASTSWLHYSPLATPRGYHNSYRDAQRTPAAASRRANANTMTTPMPLVAEDPGHPTRGEGRAINAARSPIELPVEDEEEIVMSSTAYPGQEWRPAGLGGWEYF